MAEGDSEECTASLMQEVRRHVAYLLPSLPAPHAMQVTIDVTPCFHVYRDDQGRLQSEQNGLVLRHHGFHRRLLGRRSVTPYSRGRSASPDRQVRLRSPE